MLLNEEQQAVVDCRSNKILCLAGAGAGKTATMLERIKRLVNSGVPANQILVLTFTNAAAFNMSERFKKSVNSAILPEFRTFHGFCYSVLIRSKEVREKLGYSSVPGICDEAEYKKIHTEAKIQCNTTLSDEILATPLSELKLSEKKLFEYQLYQKALKRLLAQKNVITFDLLSQKVCGLFHDNDESVQRFKDYYKCILTDEFQDCDSTQIKFLGSFPPETSQFCVGDALQNIYAFRGCTNKYIKVLSKDPNWTQFMLHKNFRSTTQICNFANSMSKYAEKSYRIEMEGQRSGEDVVVIYGSNSNFNEPVDISHVSKLIKMVKSSDEESAILCRTNKEVACICNAFKEAEIEYTTSNKTNDDVELLKCSLDNLYAVNWLSTFLDSSRYADYIRNSYWLEPGRDMMQWFRQNYGSNTKVADRLKKIDAIKEILVKYDRPEDKFEKIVKLLKTKMKSVTVPTEDTDDDVLIQYIIDNIEDIEDHKVYVGTIHSSKGLEYEHVYIMGVNDGMFILDSEEMLNLYYVGITRAMNRLTIFRR